MSEAPRTQGGEEQEAIDALQTEAEIINKALDVTVWRINKFSKKLLDGKPVTAQDVVRMARGEEGSEERKKLDALVAEADTFNSGFLNTRWWADTICARANTTKFTMTQAVNDAAGVEPKQLTGSSGPMSETMRRMLTGRDHRDDWSIGDNH